MSPCKKIETFQTKKYIYTQRPCATIFSYQVTCTLKLTIAFNGPAHTTQSCAGLGSSPGTPQPEYLSLWAVPPTTAVCQRPRKCSVRKKLKPDPLPSVHSNRPLLCIQIFEAHTHTLTVPAYCFQISPHISEGITLRARRRECIRFQRARFLWMIWRKNICRGSDSGFESNEVLSAEVFIRVKTHSFARDFIKM